MSSAAAATESSSSSSSSGDASGDGAGAGYGYGYEEGEVSASIQLPRLPSTRPLDHRWDRSRGIVFSRFDQRRTYASKPIQRSTPTSTPATLSPKKASPSNAASAVDSGWKASFNAKPVGVSFRQGTDLEKKNRELDNEIIGLNARDRQQTAKLDAKEKQIALLNSRVAEFEGKLNAAKSQAEFDLRTLQAKHQRNLEELSPRIAENKAHSDSIRSAAQAPLLRDIHRLEESQANLQREVEALKAAMEDQQRASNNAVEDLQKQHETTLSTAKVRTRDVGFALDKATKELQGVRRRKREDREDYTQYHAVFAELGDSIYNGRDELKLARKRVDEEAKYWRNSTRSFKTSDNLRLFLHSSKYEGTKGAIEGFLQEQVAHAQETSDGLRQLELQLTQVRNDMQHDAHESRALTRHHQLDEHQSAYNSASLAQRHATIVPFEQLREAYTEDIERLEAQVEHAPDSGDNCKNLESKIKDLREERGKVYRFLKFFGYLQDWQALKALQDDDMVEKAVWVNTIKTKQALDSVVGNFHDEMEKHPPVGEQEFARRRHLYEDVRSQRVEFDILVAHVRQRHLLAHDLGKMAEKELVTVERTIKSKIEEAKRRVVGGLIGLGLQKPSRISRRPTFASTPTEALPATAATAATTDATPVALRETELTLDKLRADLEDTCALQTRKQRIQIQKEKGPDLVEKWKTASHKKTHRKVQVSRPKKSTAAKRKVPATSPSKEIKSESGKTNEPGIKAEMSGTGVSGLKPTSPMQAQYRRPSYDPEAAAASGAKRRASRSANMGFTTLKDALAPPSVPDEGSENHDSIAASTHNDSRSPGTGDGGERSSLEPDDSSLPSQPADVIGTSPSEDSASAYEQINSDEPSEAEQSSPETDDDATPEEPQTVLSYQIPPKDYRDAVMASKNSNAAFWSHTLYKNAENQKPTVFYCQSYDAAEAKAKLFLNEPVIGFDMEWEPRVSMKEPIDIKRNLSLIQIASEDKIGLFQLARFRNAKTADDHMPPSLRKILENPDIVKAGVNINGDMSRLKKCVGVEMRGVFELSHMFRLVMESRKIKVGFNLVSLSTQVQEVLLLPLKKDDVRVSAWSRELNTQQTSYAAADAYAGFQLFHKLDNARKLMVPKPPRPAFFETYQPIVLGDGRMVFRSTDPNRKRVAGKAEEVVEEEEEEEEFFDALEGNEIDPYELGGSDEFGPGIPGLTSKAIASNVLPTSAVAGAAKQEVSYPVLPPQEPSSGTVAGATAAPSRTTTLPLRAKLPSKTPAPPQTPSAEEEQLSAKRSAPQNRPGPVPCPENQVAETWMITYRAKHTDTAVGTPTLRAYHLWHYQRFELKEIAGFCRDPPLAMTTVASYIMQALKEADLPYDGGRVKDVLGVLPGSVHGRYRSVLERGGV